MDTLLPFAGLAALIVVSPGPDMMLVTGVVLIGLAAPLAARL
jgi:threonine/homoserine/homoserine lactone efflux protein